MTKKEVFFQTALELIHEQGFKAMTIRQLARALSCDSANIYNYVTSKAALLEQLLFETSADFHTGMDQILSADLDPITQIEELIRLHVYLSAEKPLRVGLLVNEWRNLKADKLAAFVGERNAYEKKVSQIFKNGVQKKVFRELDIEVSTNTILGSLRWQHDYYLKNKKQLNPLHTITLLKQLIIPGLLMEKNS